MIVSIDIPARKIDYKISTLPGQSGAPVITGNKIIAIHGGSDKSELKEMNVGRLLTAEMLENIKSWVKHLNGEPAAVSYLL